MSTFHTPVLLQEIIDYLQVEKDHKYIDATVGGGGHAVEILKRGGIVLGIDQDQQALDFVKNWLEPEYKNNLNLVKANFRDIEKVAKLYGFSKVHGILFDLGVSSYQLGNLERGFSFKHESRLDMRMDRDLQTSAFNLVNNESFETVNSILLRYGEEPKAESIARAIILARSKKDITTTKELAEIISKVYRSERRNSMKINPATRTFQALRIAVNDELEALKEGLKEAVELLISRGRVVVISYHSLEDRIVKLSMRSEKLNILTKKPVPSSFKEIRENRRARSAKLRVAQKI